MVSKVAPALVGRSRGAGPSGGCRHTDPLSILTRLICGTQMPLFTTIALALTASSPAATPAPVRSELGIVVTAHPAATNAGVAMLRAGGNAVDAAVSAAFTAGVTEPYSAGIGGGGFLLFYLAETAQTSVIDYREVAPAKATRDMYLDKDGEVILNASLQGPLAVAVPGTVKGLLTAQAKWGKLGREAILAPAIAAAEQGFAADARYVMITERSLDLVKADPESTRIFLGEGGTVASLGQLIRQPDLAETLRHIAADGGTDFYEGTTATKIASHVQKLGGLLSLDDLKTYTIREREPLVGTYRGYTIVTMPPPSSGGVHLIQMLNMLEGYDLHALGFGSSNTIHTITEVERRAYADRAEFLGDPKFVDVPVDGLTSKEYAAALRATIDDAKASPSSTITHGDPRARKAGSASNSTTTPRIEPDHTTHLSVVDRYGNAVSLTQTINGSFGSGVTVPGTGVLLNNEMDDFSAKPGVPNLFGLVGKEANAIAPGKIPLSSMTPTIVTKDGKLFMAIGSPGGSTIITTVMQCIMNVIDHDMNIAEAIAAPRTHHQWLPDELRTERFGMTVDVRVALEAKGHKVSEQSNLGNAMGILVDPKTGVRTGSADPRGVGTAGAE